MNVDFRQVAAAAYLFICAMKQYGDFLPSSVSPILHNHPHFKPLKVTFMNWKNVII